MKAATADLRCAGTRPLAQAHAPAPPRRAARRRPRRRLRAPAAAGAADAAGRQCQGVARTRVLQPADDGLPRRARPLRRLAGVYTACARCSTRCVHSVPRAARMASPPATCSRRATHSSSLSARHRASPSQATSRRRRAPLAPLPTRSRPRPTAPSKPRPRSNLLRTPARPVHAFILPP
jgi:bacterioferritin-associated ferredoxin|eukprot:6432926-Prymnesium_polylepis.2